MLICTQLSEQHAFVPHAMCCVFVCFTILSCIYIYIYTPYHNPDIYLIIVDSILVSIIPILPQYAASCWSVLLCQRFMKPFVCGKAFSAWVIFPVNSHSKMGCVKPLPYIITNLNLLRFLSDLSLSLSSLS